jgi:hypothetical protein
MAMSYKLPGWTEWAEYFVGGYAKVTIIIVN